MHPGAKPYGLSVCADFGGYYGGFHRAVLASRVVVPVDITLHNPSIDHLFSLTFIAMGAIFVLAQLGLAWLVWSSRARKDGRRAAYLLGDARLEVAWMVVAAILFIGLDFMGYRTWAQMHYTGAQSHALRIEVWGEQFASYFRYPGPDGVFGPVHPSLMNDPVGNYRASSASTIRLQKTTL